MFDPAPEIGLDFVIRFALFQKQFVGCVARERDDLLISLYRVFIAAH
jgi:hypothetical protein